MQAGERLAQGRERIGHRAPVLARVDGVVERPNLDNDRNDAAEGRRQRRLALTPVARVGQDDGVGLQLVAVAIEERGEMLTARLLLALDEDGDPDRR